MTLHTHGLGLHEDILFAVNHAFKGGGERIERWRIERLPGHLGHTTVGPPVALTHLGSVTGHDGDDDLGTGAWSFTVQLNAAINDIAPVGPHEWFMTQFLDAPASLEGGGTPGTPHGYVPAPEPSAVADWARSCFARWLGDEMIGALLLPPLRRTRIWHCHCAGLPGPAECPRTVCEPVGPPSTKWNGITWRQSNSSVAAADGRGAGFLYVNDIFQRHVVEFAVGHLGRGAQLERRRTWRSSFLLDNVHLDAKGEGLWLGGLSPTKALLLDGIGAMRERAATARRAALEAGLPTPRPHLHLRPNGVDAPPEPPMPAGALHIDLASGAMTTRLLQSSHLASVSWSHQVGGRLFLGSPWDDGVLVCDI